MDMTQKLYENVLNIIRENPDIHDQFMLSLTYNTNRIEGSTLTEPETAAILFQNIVLPDKSLVEHLEAKNHQTALNYLFDYMASGSMIDEDLILALHRILMNSIMPDAGHYRTHSVRIVGADLPTANYVKIPLLMTELIDYINSDINDTVSHIAKVHSRFEQIHPFSDGNGRVGRLLIHAMALRKNLPPAVVRQENKRFYHTYLNKAQQTQNQDTSLLEDFICDALSEGYRLLERL
ncbi:MAG: Fic family protein [Candidatus Omnitrophota bacterium]